MARGDGGRGRLQRNKKETRKERGGCESIRQGARYGQCEAERRDQDRRKGGAVRPVGDREGEGEGRRKGGGGRGQRGEGERVRGWETPVRAQRVGGGRAGGRDSSRSSRKRRTQTFQTIEGDGERYCVL